MKEDGEGSKPEAIQYSLVKAMIAAAKRFRKHGIVHRNLSYSTIERLKEEGYKIARRGRGATSFMLVVW